MSTPERDTAPDKEQFVSSLARGIAVLRAFGPGTPELTLSQVAALTDLSPAVARRFLLTLVQLGYLRRIDRRFVLTPKVMEIGASYPDSMNLSEVAQPFLQPVRDETGDSVSLTTLSGDDIIHLAHVQTERMLRFAVTPGTHVPAYVSASGRAMLAFLPQDQLDDYLAGLEVEQRTPYTVTSKDELRERLREARRTGYALVVDELDMGITVIGVPILIGGLPLAGVSCAAASGTRPPEEFAATRLPLLQYAAGLLKKQIERSPALIHSLEPAR